MSLILSGSDGVSDIDGSASTPAIRGTDANTGIFFPAADTIAFSEGGSEAMRIDSSGNVGIGTSTTTDAGVTITTNVTRDNFWNAKLALQSTGASNYPTLLFSGCSATNRYGAIVQTASTSGNDGNQIAATIEFLNSTATACNIVFSTSGNFGTTGATERARINSAGTLGLLNGGGGAGDNTLGLNNPQGSSSTTWFILGNHTATTTLNNTGTSAFRVATNGDVTNLNGTYGTISDLKLKQDIVDANSQWNDIKNLRFRNYRLKSEVESNPDAKLLLGLVAQEVEQVSPHLVENFPDFEDVEVTDDDGNVTVKRQETGTNTKALKTSIIYMKAVKALQEAMERIETLEAQNAAFETRLAALENK